MSEVITGFKLYLGVVVGKLSVFAIFLLILFILYMVFGKER